MKFSDFKQEGQKLGVGGSGYLRLESGENKIRILTGCEPIASHFLGKGSKPAACTMDDTCKFCLSGVKKTVKVLCYIYDYSDSIIKLAELAWSIFKQVGELAASSEYGYTDLPPYDIIVNKTGEGMETRYSVTPGRNDKPLDAEIMKELKEKKEILV